MVVMIGMGDWVTDTFVEAISCGPSPVYYGRTLLYLQLHADARAGEQSEISPS